MQKINLNKKQSTNLNKQISRRHLKSLLKKLTAALFVILTLAITYLPFTPSWDDIYAAVGLRSTTADYDLKDLTMTFIDVGQGDSCLIHTESTSILIDTGPNGNAQNIKDILDSYGISELDYLIITHPHDDHIGSLDELEKLITIKNEIIPTETSKMSGLTLTLKANDTDNFTLDFLAPIYASEDENNMSLVIKLTYKNISALFMGDAEVEEESSILRTYSAEELKADILKVGHHGSESSSSQAFLQSVAPTYAVISVGTDNDYGHPHAATLKTLASVGTETHRTDQEGTIIFTTDGETIDYVYLK